MPNFVAEINMDIGYFKNKKIKKKKKSKNGIETKSGAAWGIYGFSLYLYRAHVEVLLVLGFPPTLVSCYSAVKMYLTLFWGLVFVDKHSHCGSLQSQSLRNSFSSVLQFL